jgi:hypothetical protein
MSDIELITVHDPADCEEAEAEIRRLRAKLTLAEYALGTIVHMGDGCEVACCHIKSPYTLADDALTQMSVVE